MVKNYLISKEIPNSVEEVNQIYKKFTKNDQL